MMAPPSRPPATSVIVAGSGTAGGLQAWYSLALMGGRQGFGFGVSTEAIAIAGLIKTKLRALISSFLSPIS